MKLSPRHGVLGGALALALALAWWDWRPAPAAALAAVAPSAPKPARETTLALAQVDAFLADYRASQVETRRPLLPGTLRDLFALPEQARERPAAPTTQPEPEADATAPRRLEAVLLGPNPMALVDGRLRRVHEVIDGWALVEVRRDGAAFRHEPSGMLHTLSLPRVGARERR